MLWVLSDICRHHPSPPCFYTMQYHTPPGEHTDTRDTLIPWYRQIKDERLERSRDRRDRKRDERMRDQGWEMISIKRREKEIERLIEREMRERNTRLCMRSMRSISSSPTMMIWLWQQLLLLEQNHSNTTATHIIWFSLTTLAGARSVPLCIVSKPLVSVK